MTSGWSLVSAVTGGGPTSRPEAVGIAAVAGAIAAWMTWVAVLWLRRPVEPDPVTREERERAALQHEGFAAREEHDRRAWRSR